MCGRYTLIKLSDFTDMFPWIHPPDGMPSPRYNIAPTQAIAVVPNDGKNQIDFFHWGLIPSWAKDPAIGNRMINARAETLAEKPAFRSALKRRRCLVLADGFFEWQKLPDGKTKQPMYIRLRSHKPFAFAGLWETWHDDSGTEVPSATIITTEPNSLMKPIHDRMPAIVRSELYKKWLTTKEQSADVLSEVFEPYPVNEMEAYAISRRVNSPANDRPDVIEPESEASPTPSGAGSGKRTRQRREDSSQGLFD